MVSRASGWAFEMWSSISLARVLGHLQQKRGLFVVLQAKDASQPQVTNSPAMAGRRHELRQLGFLSEKTHHEEELLNAPA